MDHLTLQEANEKWEVTLRRINHLCAAGRILGVVRMFTLWLIPKDAKIPNDGKKCLNT